MANLHLVTGYAGQEHITSADQGSFNASFFGSGQYVLQRGNELAASIVSNNQVRVLDGDIYMQGRHIRLNEGIYVDLAIENGTQGQNRNDLIVARYTKNASTGVEECNLVVIKGTATTGTASDPAYTKGDILNANALQNDMPLYRVRLSGLTVQPLVKLFTTIEDVFSMLDVYKNSLRFRRLLTSADDMNNLFEDGIYVYSTASVPKNAPFQNAAVIEVFGADSTSTQKIQRGTRYGEVGQCKFRPLLGGTGWLDWEEFSMKSDLIDHTTDKNNPHDVTADQIGAAKSGYGYGGTVVAFDLLSDESALENRLNTELAKMNSGEAKQIAFALQSHVKEAPMIGTLFKSSDYYAILSAVSELSTFKKIYFGDTWYPLEWENPRFAEGVEYRTTERVKEKPVYAKRVAMGALPNTERKYVSYSTDPATIVEVVGRATNSSGTTAFFPFFTTSGAARAKINTTQYIIEVYTWSDLSAYTAEFDCYYTKD